MSYLTYRKFLDISNAEADTGFSVVSSFPFEYDVPAKFPSLERTWQISNSPKEEKAAIVRKIQLYFAEELKQEIGGFDAEFLLDFFADEIGSYFYNRGLYDSQAILSAKLDDLSEAIYQLERPTELRR